MGLLRRRNRRSALADRRLMAQLLGGQLDRLACAKYGMRLLVFPKIFKAGLGTSGGAGHIPRYGVPAGCARIRPGDAGRRISWNRIDGVRSVAHECVSAGAKGIRLRSRFLCMACRRAGAAGKTTGYQWTWLSRST